MMSNCKLMLVFEISGPNLVSVPNFSSIFLQMTDFSVVSLIGKSVILLPWQQLKFNKLV